jgi:hypothetical protein
VKEERGERVRERMREKRDDGTSNNKQQREGRGRDSRETKYQRPKKHQSGIQTCVSDCLPWTPFWTNTPDSTDRARLPSLKLARSLFFRQ